MPLCGASGCGSTTAALKCARCQGVFYCNEACQLADWKRHKPYCTHLPSSAAASSPTSMPPRQLQPALVDTSALHAELYRVVHACLNKVRTTPASLKKELASVRKETQPLLAQGARPDVSVALPDGTKPSCLASFCMASRACPATEPLLQLLLDAKCEPAVDPDASFEPSSDNRVKPLYYAIRCFRPSIVRLLVEHGADVHAPCAQLPNGGVVWPVLSCYSSICRPHALNQPIDGALETLDYLLAAGADVDAFDDRWFDDEPPDGTALLNAVSPLPVPAAFRAVLDAVAMRLIDAGANVNARHYQQMRPIDLAAGLPSLDIFKALIAKGADPTPVPYVGILLGKTDSTTERPVVRQAGTHYLQAAINHGRADVLQAAAAAGVKLERYRTLGSMSVPLLALAAANGQLACVRALLEYGVDVNEVYEAGATRATACDSVDYPGRDGSSTEKEIWSMLRSAGGKFYDEL